MTDLEKAKWLFPAPLEVDRCLYRWYGRSFAIRANVSGPSRGR